MRDYSIDYAKGVAILLVYVGHSILYYPPGLFNSCWWAPYLRSMVYSCNMPIFFFISGILFAYSKKSNKEVIKDKTRRLLIPYLFTMMIVGGAKLIMPASMAYNSMGGGILGVLKEVFLNGGDRWFVYVLIWIFFLSLPLRKLKKSLLIWVIIITSFVVTIFIKLPDFMRLDMIVWYIGFFLMGMYLNQFYSLMRKWNTAYWFVVVIIFILLNLILVNNLMPIPIMQVVVLPLTGTVGVMTVSWLLDDRCERRGTQTITAKYLAYCGRYSLQFYLFSFAYPVIRYMVVTVLHITYPLVIFMLVLILQLIVMTGIVEITRRIKWLRIPMGY